MEFESLALVGCHQAHAGGRQMRELEGQANARKIGIRINAEIIEELAQRHPPAFEAPSPHVTEERVQCGGIPWIHRCISALLHVWNESTIAHHMLHCLENRSRW